MNTMTNTSAADSQVADTAAAVAVDTAKTKAPRFSFTGQAWMASVLGEVGIATEAKNHPKLVAHARSLKLGSPSDLSKLKPSTLLSKVAAAMLADVKPAVQDEAPAAE